MCLRLLSPDVGRLQGGSGKAGDQLFAGDASEAAAPVHRAGRPHSVGRRHPRHLHQGLPPPRFVSHSNKQAKLKRVSRTTEFTLGQRWRSGWWLWGSTGPEKQPFCSSWSRTSSCSPSQPSVRTSGYGWTVWPLKIWSQLNFWFWLFLRLQRGDRRVQELEIYHLGRWWKA